MQSTKRIIILSALIFNTLLANAQCDKCSIEKIKAVYEHLDNLTFEVIRGFLCTFDSSCKTNVEYSEWSNEMLFKVISRSPEIFFRVLEKEKINNALLIKEIEDPILDFDFQNIYNKIETTSASEDLKKYYLNALKMVIDEATNEKKIIDTIAKLPEVKERAEYIEKQTQGKRHLIIWIYHTHEIVKKKYYWVKTGENNGTNLVTHFNFFVYPTSMEIKFFDTVEDKEVDLKIWRQKNNTAK